jgi:hypothetical protein
VGHVTAPLEAPPRQYCKWKHRFDDPQRKFQTLYAAVHLSTCLKEVLGPLRPDLIAQAEFARIRRPDQALAGLIKRSDIEQRALAQGVLEIYSGEIIDLNSMAVRAEMERQHAAELRKLGLRHLDISALLSPSRKLTQFLARTLYDRGAAGVLYKSNWDGEICVALFEKRARIRPVLGAPIRPLTDPIPELLSVLVEYGLQVTPF